MKKIYTLLSLLSLTAVAGYSQNIKVNAGPNHCRFYQVSDTLRVGEPAIGAGPFTYSWSIVGGGPVAQYLDSTSIARPKLTGYPGSQALDSVDFELFVTGPNGAGRDTVRVYYTNLFCTAQSCSVTKRAGDTVQLSNSCSTNLLPLTYRWAPAEYISDSTAGEPRIWTPISRIYRSIVTDRIGCSWRSDCVVTVVDTSTPPPPPPPAAILASTGRATALVLAPNPITASSTLTLGEGWPGSRYRIYGADGRLVRAGACTARVLPLGDLLMQPPGVYQLQVVGSDGKQEVVRLQVR